MNHRRTKKAITNAQRSGARVATETSEAVVTEAADAFDTPTKAQTMAKPSICTRLMFPVLLLGIDEFSYDMLTEERCF